MIRVYVAAAVLFAQRAYSMGRLLSVHGLQITSRWAEGATDDPVDAGARKRILDANLADIEAADVIVALTDHGRPRATYGEIAWALGRGKPVVWVIGDNGQGANIWTAHPHVVTIEHDNGLANDGALAEKIAAAVARVTSEVAA